MKCDPLCQCYDCENDHDHVRTKIKKKFSGCTCSKSGCIKGYCECYGSGKLTNFRK